MNKNLVLRTCIASRCTFPKYFLLRVVIDKNKNIFIDVDCSIAGRGAYFVLNNKNIVLIKKKKILDKKLKMYIPNIIYQKLFQMVKQKKNCY